MSRTIAEHAAACLQRLNIEHLVFEGCDMSSARAVADRIRVGIRTFDLPNDDGLHLRFAREGESPDALVQRCLTNTWRVVGHEYTLATLDYNSSPDPIENSRGNPFGEWTWQLNRHEEWVVAALHYDRTGDAEAAAAVCSWLRTWIESCPAPTDAFNTERTSWRTIEIGIRLGGKWPPVFATLKDADALDDELLLAWLNSVAEQCDFVWPNRKRNNWLMMEMNGLLTAAIMFPFFTDAPDWQANALRVHLEEADKQFLADGMQVELSASYHGVSVLQYLRAYRMLEHVGEDVPHGLLDGMRSMLRPWRAMARPDGHVFDFQDTDVVMYPDWLRKLPREIQTEDDAFFRGEGPAPHHTNDLLPNAGQCVLRSGWTMDDTAVAIDVGPFGDAHQHEDKLSIQIWSRGHDLLGEAGKVAYADSPERRYSLGTLAHSTAIVDGQPQNSRRLFRRGDRPLDAPAELSCDLDSDAPWVRAAYRDGYGPDGAVDVVHERTVTLKSRDLIVVTDRFCADDSASHQVEVLFHLLCEGFELSDHEARSTGSGPRLILRPRRSDGQAVMMSGVCGGTAPDLRGWAAMDKADYKGVNAVVPRPCITMSADVHRELELITEVEIVD